MRVVPRGNGKSWTIWADYGVELGIIVRSLSGRGREMFGVYSSATNGTRWDLGATFELDAAVRRIEAFSADPGPIMARSHRVVAEAVERRR